MDTSESKKRITGVTIHRKAFPHKEKMGQIDHVVINLDGKEVFISAEEDNGKGFKIIQDDSIGIEYLGKYLTKQNAKRVWDSGYKDEGNLRKYMLPIIKETIDNEYENTAS